MISQALRSLGTVPHSDPLVNVELHDPCQGIDGGQAPAGQIDATRGTMSHRLFSAQELLRFLGIFLFSTTPGGGFQKANRMPRHIQEKGK